MLETSVPHNELSGTRKKTEKGYTESKLVCMNLYTYDPPSGSLYIWCIMY